MLVWKNSTSPAATFSTGSPDGEGGGVRSEEHTSELQSLRHLVCRLLLEKKKNVWPVIALPLAATLAIYSPFGGELRLILAPSLVEVVVLFPRAYGYRLSDFPPTSSRVPF